MQRRLALLEIFSLLNLYWVSISLIGILPTHLRQKMGLWTGVQLNPSQIIALPPIICIGLCPYVYNHSCHDRQYHPQATCSHQSPVHHCCYSPATPQARNFHRSRALRLDIMAQNRKEAGLPNTAAYPRTAPLQHWRRPLPGAVPKQVPAATSVGYMFVQCRALRHHGEGSQANREDRATGGARAG